MFPKDMLDADAMVAKAKDWKPTPGDPKKIPATIRGIAEQAQADKANKKGAPGPPVPAVLVK